MRDEPAPPAAPEPVDADVLVGWVTALGRVCPETDRDRVDVLGVLEQLKCAAAGAQARVTAAFSDSQRAAQRDAGAPAREIGKGIGAQVGLARRESPVRGRQHLGVALALREMPHAAAALCAGEISEWRATLLVRETACLTRVDRGIVDAVLAARPGGLTALGDRAAEVEARRIAYRLDPYAFTRRAAKAEADRRVTIRPAPDSMAYVAGLLPMRQGIAVHATLTRHADSLRSSGDPRSRGQIMADTLVERVTGQATATGVPIEVQVVITDGALLAGDDTPADVDGFGPVPAPLARQWLTGNSADNDAEDDAEDEATVYLRRLFTDPAGGHLVAMDSTQRTFTGGIRRFIKARDRRCRTPWCDAPIRHLDHPNRVADGGQTTVSNGQGLCEACNHAKEATGWHATAGTIETDTIETGSIETRTPTGHHHTSRPPPPVTGPRTSRIEVHLNTMLLLMAG